MTTKLTSSVQGKISIRSQGRTSGPRRFIALLAFIPALSACDDLQFPRDPEGTLKSVVSDGEMTVAVSLNPPWTDVDRDGELSGVEVELVEDFADELGARIVWRRLDAFAALASLEQDDVDLAIGGFTRKDVMPVAGVAPSYVFYEEDSVLAVRGERPDDAKPQGDRVFVPQHLPLAELVTDEGGRPVDEWSEDVKFAAVPRWQAAALGLTPVDVILHRADHVVVVRQGENGWLMEIERFLRRQTSNLDERLRANQR